MPARRNEGGGVVVRSSSIAQEMWEEAGMALSSFSFSLSLSLSRPYQLPAYLNRGLLYCLPSNVLHCEKGGGGGGESSRGRDDFGIVTG